MKRIILIALLSLLIAFNASAKWYYTTHQVYVRAGAGTGFKEIGVLPPSTNVEISEISGSWGKTLYKNRDGFIAVRFLKELPPATKQGEYQTPWYEKVALFLIVFALLRAFYIGFRNERRRMRLTPKPDPKGYTLIGGQKIPNANLPIAYIDLVNRIKLLEDLKSQNESTRQELRKLKEGLDDFNTAVRLSGKMK